MESSGQQPAAGSRQDGGSEPGGGRRGVTLVAMTLAGSMILVDQTAVPLATPDTIRDLDGSIAESQWILTANVLPLAGLMVLGGRLGDLVGLRRIFLLGALIFVCSSTLAGAAQSMEWLIIVRATQGVGAALMMPTSIAIVSRVFPGSERGRALGILAGASAFFAALGPVLGGALTSIDWRLVFWINVPLATTTILLTLSATPRLRPDPGASRRIDYAGAITLGLGLAAIVYGLSEGQTDGWGAPGTVIPLAGGFAALIAFVVVEHLVEQPLIEFRLFRHLNFLAANISQVLAGMIELGLGFLLPYYLLIVVGFSPLEAGLALIPSTVPIILVGPLAGRAFDRIGGRWPLVVGFLILAASGAALALAASDRDLISLLPGLILQGTGLGIVLTVNDPTGLSAVPKKDQGEAAGIINTSEQFGGALGIAGLTALLLGYYTEQIYDKLAKVGVSDPTQAQVDRFKEFIQQAEQQGREHVRESKFIQEFIPEVLDAHIAGNEVVFYATAGIALVGAVVSFLLVRKGDRVTEGPVFGRRSRWLSVGAGRTPGITREPPEAVDEPPAAGA